MKKHIIIAGTCRSGKTTLSIELRKLGYTHYKMDSIVRGICKIFNLNRHNWEKLSVIFAKLINIIIKESYTDMVGEYEKYVFDIPQLFPKDIKFIDTKNVIVIFLGYAHVTKEEVFKNIRRNDKVNYWSAKVSDNELLKRIDDNIKFSNYLEEECKRLNILYFDTGIDRDQTLKKIIKYIKKMNK